jgi:hypothetical protein
MSKPELERIRPALCGSFDQRRAQALFALLIVLLALAAGCRISGARDSGERFIGQVTDIATGEPISGALLQVGKGTASSGAVGSAETRSDDEGRYELRVAAGPGSIRVTAPGYIGMTETRQALAAGEVKTLDFQMFPEELTAEQEAALQQKLGRLMQAQEAPSKEQLEAASERGFGVSAIKEAPRTLRVLMPDGTVVEMGMDEYLKGVVPHEMGVLPNWPLEALKAQAVAARSYATTTYKHSAEGADVCTTTHCQVWRSTHYDSTDRAVDETHGVAARYGGNIVQAFFFGHDDGHTRNSEDVWGGYLPYCRAVECPCGFTTMWGHGVGMCQEGARALARQGASFQEILKHYYTGVEVATSSAPPKLSAGQVSPAEGHAYTPFVFSITYADADGDPPAEAVVVIDGLSQVMSYAGGDRRQGARYVYTGTLSAGEHSFRFYFDDGYGNLAAWPAQGPLNGPTVSEPPRGYPTLTPTPIPSAGHTLGVRWSQTTERDWAGATATNIVTSTLGNGALLLAGDALSGMLLSRVYEAPLQFVAAGADWLADLPTGSELQIELRASADGSKWSNWQPVSLLDAENTESQLPRGELVYLNGRFLQYRLQLRRSAAAIQPVVRALTCTLIDSRWGPTAQEARLQALAREPETKAAGPTVIRRAEWGANEAWMTWAPEYRTPKTFVIHHTVTSSGGLDPAAVVRAIYYYHAVTNDWGDIAYNYLIDDRGNIYEGRYGGEQVVGGHAKQYNWGSIGIAVLGDYSSATPAAASLNSLVELMAWKGNLYYIHPLQQGAFIDKVLPNIMAHRDCQPETTCPGNGMYAQMATLRQRVMTRMAQLVPSSQIVEPAADALLNGVRLVSVRGSPAVNSISIYVDGAQRAASASSALQWKWNTTADGDGIRQLRLVVSTSAGVSSEKTISVRVDNTPPSGSVSLPAFTNRREVQLGLQASEATQMQISRGWLWEGEGLRHQDSTGQAVEDADASAGRAWLGRAAADRPGIWYGPYLCDLPLGASYWAYFRLKTPQNTSTAQVALLDVVDTEGTRTYISRRIEGRDFVSAGRYVEFALPFTYADKRNTCATAGAEDGLEFRTWFSGGGDLYLDRVQLFTAPESYRSSMALTLSAGEGNKEISVRYLDQAGNPSAVYAATTLLDLTSPVWMGGGGEGYALVRDALSGLDTGSGEYALSSNGQLWGGWQAATVEGAQGGTTAAFIRGATVGGCFIRFRVRDRAGNSSESPVYALPCGGTPTATRQASATPTGTRMTKMAHLPLVLRDMGGPSAPTRTPVPTGYPAAVTATSTATTIAAATATATLIAPSATPTPTTAAATPTPTSTPYTAIYVYGTVYDTVTDAGAFVGSATVDVFLPGEHVQVTADALGRYIARFAVTSNLSGQRVDVMATKEGYWPGVNYGFVPTHTPGTIQFVQLNVILARR